LNVQVEWRGTKRVAPPALVGLVLLSCATVDPDPTAVATPAPATDRVAFGREGKVVILDLGTRDERTLEADGYTVPIAFSLDGTSIFAMEHIEGAPGPSLVRHDLDTGDNVSVSPVATSFAGPALSPDGRVIAFARGSDANDGSSGIGLLDLANGEVAVFPEAGPTETLVWSPDGSALLYGGVDDASGFQDAYVIDVRSGQPRRVTNDEAYDLPIGWTEDGSGILVSSDRGAGRADSVWEVSLDDGTLTRRPNAQGSPSAVLRSPDGRWDVIHGRRTLLLGRAGAGNGQQIRHSSGVRSAVSWSPNGEWLLWTGLTGGDVELFLMRVPDGEPERLTETEAEETTPVWGPSRAGFP
jgi:Tol biopolymer transport system component